MTTSNASNQFPQSFDDHKIPVTFFPSHTAKTKTSESLTLPELGDKILQMTKPGKKRLPWLKLAVFGDARTEAGALRHDGNVLSITGVEVDYDTCRITFDEAVERLWAAGVRAIVYTSPSYQKGVAEKWRVLCPTSKSLPPERRYELVAALHGLLGEGIDPVSFTLSQSYYYGSVNSNPDHRVEALDGDFIDLRLDLLSAAVGRPEAVKRETLPTNRNLLQTNASPSYSDEEINRLLDRTQYRNSDGSGNWHPNMLAVTGALVGRGLGNDAIAGWVGPYCDGGRDDEEMLAMVASAREKWGIPDPDIPAGAKLGPDVLAAIAADAPRLVEPQWRERYVNWNPKPSFHNTRLAIEALGVECSEDVFHNELYIGRSSAIAPSNANWPFAGLVTDAGLGALRTLISTTWGLDFGERNVRDAVNAMCHENQFNPVVEMLAEAEASWDRVARLDRMAVDHFNTDDTEFNRICVRKTMIAAVARARQPGVKFDTILIMESPEGLNKSSAWAVLAGEGNFSDESILGKASREVQEHLAGVWIHENAELAGITKGEIETIKAFASRQVDRARPAYGHYLVKQPRHSIEVGTTNAYKYMPSDTGNRRFWPITVRSMIDLQKLRAARLQLWGEAAHYQSKGEALTLPEAMWADAGVIQEERRIIHPWEALLEELSDRDDSVFDSAYFNRGAAIAHVVGDERRVATVDLYKYIGVSAGQQHMGHAKTLASIMRKLGWTNKVFKIGGKVFNGYVRTSVMAGWG
jgi:predicted P-loop ATPase